MENSDAVIERVVLRCHVKGMVAQIEYQGRTHPLWDLISEEQAGWFLQYMKAALAALPDKHMIADGELWDFTVWAMAEHKKAAEEMRERAAAAVENWEIPMSWDVPGNVRKEVAAAIRALSLVED